MTNEIAKMDALNKLEEDKAEIFELLEDAG